MEMNRIWIFLALVFGCVACTDENFIDTGNASGVYDGSVMQYLRHHPQNWDSTVVVIEWAGLTQLFEGKDPEYPEITFFGPTNLSIIRYMLDNDIERIKDVEPEVWKNMMLRYVIVGKHKREEVSKGDSKTGGDSFVTLGGNQLRIYRVLAPYKETPEAGPAELWVHSFETGYSVVQVASADIEPNNGIVHSLMYAFTFGKL